ncbi:MAG TPA: hypothetical protein PLR47_02165, partial [Smithellaceae bacterium]|nr:hypothetical protein [Smithellaceae bacterium]
TVKKATTTIDVLVTYADGRKAKTIKLCTQVDAGGAACTAPAVPSYSASAPYTSTGAFTYTNPAGNGKVVSYWFVIVDEYDNEQTSDKKSFTTTN